MNLPFAYGTPPATGLLRQAPEDFQVEEMLGFEPEGEGEHLWLWVEKRELNTDDLARQLAKLAEVRRSEVSYAGLKDHHAVTRQWFSIHMSKDERDPVGQWRGEHWRVLNAARARRKIRRGSLHGNRFIIIVRALQGDRCAIETRLTQIAEHGVPNYFGEQRFGQDNISRAEAMVRGELSVSDRHLRGIYLSSLRSALFNAVLAHRVGDGTWDRALPGEALNLDGSRSFFVTEDIDEAIICRLAKGDIHPTGPLWGKDEPPSRGKALALEQSIIGECPEIWGRACRDRGMAQERRPLRLLAKHLIWQWQDNDVLRLEFSLPAGAYATTMIREIAIY